MPRYFGTMTTLTKLSTVYLPLQTADDARDSEEIVHAYGPRWNLSDARMILIRGFYFRTIAPMNWRRRFSNPTPGCTAYPVEHCTDSQYSHAWNEIRRLLGAAVVQPRDLSVFLTNVDQVLRWSAIESVARWQHERFGVVDA